MGIWLGGLGSGFAEESLPDLLLPTVPIIENHEMDVDDFLESRAHKFDVRGTFAGLRDEKIWIGNRYYRISEDIEFFNEDGDTIFLSDFKVGQKVGLVLWTNGVVLQLWKITNHQ